MFCFCFLFLSVFFCCHGGPPRVGTFRHLPVEVHGWASRSPRGSTILQPCQPARWHECPGPWWSPTACTLRHWPVAGHDLATCLLRPAASLLSCCFCYFSFCLCCRCFASCRPALLFCLFFVLFSRHGGPPRVGTFWSLPVGVHGVFQVFSLPVGVPSR